MVYHRHSASGCYFLTLCLDYTSTYYSDYWEHYRVSDFRSGEASQLPVSFFSMKSLSSAHRSGVVLSYKSSLGFSLAPSLLAFAFNSRATMPNLKGGAFLFVLTFGLLSGAATLQSRPDNKASACVSIICSRVLYKISFRHHEVLYPAG